jgi:hypothetical protein
MTDAPRLTRRELLGGAAAVGAASLVGAGSLVGPAAGFEAAPPAPAGLGAASPARASRWVGTLAGTSAPMAAPRRFSLVGVEWASPAAAIELRTRPSDGPWGPWAAASTPGHGPDGRSSADRANDWNVPGGTSGGEPAGAPRFGQPVWSGPADYVQLRSRTPVQGVRVHFVSTPASGYGGRVTGGDYPLAGPVLAAGPGQPAIIARAAWAHGHAPPAVPPAYGTVKLAFVHHSETPNGYAPGDVPAMLTSIYDYHRFVQGWHDIGYNFAVDAFGRIWEARAGGIDQAVIGAQAGGYNQVSTGVVVLGSFMSVAPSSAALAALERVLAWKLSLHGARSSGRITVRVNASDAYYTPFAPGQRVSLPRIAGHRDGDSTNCPGDALYALLPGIRSKVTARTGDPARLTITAAATTVVAGTPITLAGRLARLSGGPIAGAPIELQQVMPNGATTLLTTIAAADGSWAAELSLDQNAVIGALHRSRPAAVADATQIGVAPVVRLRVDSASPLRVSGGVRPDKPSVTVQLYRLAGARRQLMRQHRVAVRHGRFATTIRAVKHGRYVLQAVTPGDARNVSGSSPDVHVTV